MVADVISLGLSGCEIAFSVVQFFSGRNRNRKEATIHAWEELEKNVFLQEGYKKLALRGGADYVLGGQGEWKRAEKALSKVEHFAVAVNVEIYDLDTLNRLAGSFIIKEYERWRPVIDTKRQREEEPTFCKEFEALYVSLKKFQ